MQMGTVDGRMWATTSLVSNTLTPVCWSFSLFSSKLICHPSLLTLCHREPISTDSITYSSLLSLLAPTGRRETTRLLFSHFLLALGLLSGAGAFSSHSCHWAAPPHSPTGKIVALWLQEFQQLHNTTMFLDTSTPAHAFISSSFLKVRLFKPSE